MTDDENVIPFSKDVAEAVKLIENMKKQPKAADAPNINSTKEAIEWLNKDHFTTRITGKFKAVRENPDGSIEISDKRDIINDFDHMRLLITDDKGESKSKPITEIWFKSPSRRHYPYGFDFDPPLVGNRSGKYNLFKGYKVKPIAGDAAPKAYP